jgi:hypothetical protein
MAQTLSVSNFCTPLQALHINSEEKTHNNPKDGVSHKIYETRRGSSLNHDSGKKNTIQDVQLEPTTCLNLLVVLQLVLLNMTLDESEWLATCPAHFIPGVRARSIHTLIQGIPYNAGST